MSVSKENKLLELNRKKFLSLASSTLLISTPIAILINERKEGQENIDKASTQPSLTTTYPYIVEGNPTNGYNVITNSGIIFNGYRIHGLAYINLGVNVIYAYIAFNYFQENYGLKDNSTGQPLGFFSLQQITINVKLVQHLFFYSNVNENDPMYIPSSQTYTAQFNIGIS
jgi:hypothetical protein